MLPSIQPLRGSIQKAATPYTGVVTLGLVCVARRATYCTAGKKKLAPTEKAGGVFLTTNSGSNGGGTAPIILGLMSSLSNYISNLGFFRPIGAMTTLPTTSLPYQCQGTIGPTGQLEDPHIKLIHSVFNMKEDLSTMTAVTRDEAMELLSSNKEEELSDRILSAFTKYRKTKDFVVVQGASMPSEGLSFDLNCEMAKMFELPIMMSIDCYGVRQTDEIVNLALISKREYNNRKIDLQNILLNRVRPELYNLFSQECKERFKSQGLSLAGVLPNNSVLGSVRLNEISSALNADLLYGAERFADPDVEISQLLVATTQLNDLINNLAALPKTPGRGPLIFTSADRLDLLLGLSYSALSANSTPIAGIILTGNQRPSNSFDTIMKGLPSDMQALPVLSVKTDSYQTSVLASGVRANILPSSTQKIDESILMWNEHIDDEAMKTMLSQDRLKTVTPKLFQHMLIQKAKKSKQHIVLPEGEDKRILQAAAQLLSHHICDLTILGNVNKINSLAGALGLDLSQANIVDPMTAKKTKDYAEFIFEKRKTKGVNEDMAMDLAQDLTYYGTCMVATGDADGMVSGAVHTTANTVRPALQLIKTRPDRPVVSSVFFMLLPDKVLVYGDCAINVNPTSETLAQIAVTSAETAAAFNIDPKLAMLSYATGDSNTGPLIDKVREAVVMAKILNPNIPIEGPIQYDA
eukprot:Ihof_evm1s685 gene=Ihof_evmTU1s685